MVAALVKIPFAEVSRIQSQPLYLESSKHFWFFTLWNGERLKGSWAETSKLDSFCFPVSGEPYLTGDFPDFQANGTLGGFGKGARATIRVRGNRE